jgi:hypothetical protein
MKFTIGVGTTEGETGVSMETKDAQPNRER